MQIESSGSMVECGAGLATDCGFCIGAWYCSTDASDSETYRSLAGLLCWKYPQCQKRKYDSVNPLSNEVLTLENVWRHYRRWERRPGSLKEAFVRFVQRDGWVYEDFWALPGISLAVQRGEVVGSVVPMGLARVRY
jgi:hypothetical protein